jgi:hypothetical protein
MVGCPFIDSPVKNQIHSSPYYVNVNKTVTNKGNMATVKFFDVEKILDKKINTYERFKVKQFITEKKLDRIASSALPGTCTNTTSTTFTVSGLVAGEDWRKVLYDGSSAYEPVFIENYYYVISGITAPADGEQVVTVTHKRLLTANAFSSVGTLETFSGKKAYRKTWSPVSQTFLADHQIDTQIDFSNAITRNGITVTASDSDVNGIEYILEDSKDSVILEVDKGDKDTGYTKITSRPASNFFSSKYLTDSITGKLIVNNPIFDGFVETKKADVKQAFKYEIVGRDSISKLLNTSLDKNYVHSDEFVYTTFNPYVGNATNSTELSSSGITISSISGATLTVGSDPTSAFSYGDVIALRLNPDNRYVTLGVVSSTTSTTIVLMKDSYITDITNVGSSSFVGSNNIYKVQKSIIPSKNLETTPHVNNRSTSLAGVLDKGLVFGAGMQFDVNGDTTLLSLGKGAGVENGYDIDNFLSPLMNDNPTIFLTAGDYLDFPLGFKTNLNIPASTPELEIISGDGEGESGVVYELGYVSPIVLGMVLPNPNDYNIVQADGGSMHPVRLINGQGLPDGGFLHLLNNKNNSDYSPKTFNNIFSDDPSWGSTVKSQYALRYNQPIFRYKSKYKNNYKIIQPYANKVQGTVASRFSDAASVSDQIFDIFYSRNDYHENTQNFNFYLSAYKLTKKNVDYNADTSTYYLKGLPTEQCGLYPVLGSKFFDINRFPDWYYDSADFFNMASGGVASSALQYYVGKMELHDPSALSMHLFSLGDVYPESKKNQNNIFTSHSFTNTRDVSQYSLVFKKNKSESSDRSNLGYTHFRDLFSPNNIQISSRTDSEYHTEPIQSIEGEQKRFNLLRLTDVTMDMLFNEVDYENLKVNNNGTEISKLSTKGNTRGGALQHVLIKSFPQAGLHHKKVEVTGVSSTANQLTVTTSHWYNSDYDYHIYFYEQDSGVTRKWYSYVGKVTSAPDSTTIAFTSTTNYDAVNVANKELYVQTAPSGILDNTTKNNVMLLTDTGSVPHFPEDTTARPNNYLKTAFFSNSNLETHNGTTTGGSPDADDTFTADPNISSSNNISAILRTPMFKGHHGEAGSDGNIKVVKSFNDGLKDGITRANFHFKASVTCSGATITFPSGSLLTQFFDTVQRHKVMFSDGNMDEDRLFGDASSQIYLTSVGGGSGPSFEVSSSHDTSLLETGMKFDLPSHSSDTYTITEITSSSRFKVSPNHGGTGGSGTIVDMVRGIIENNGAIISITGFTHDTTKNKNYRVSSYTDTTITLQDIAGNTASLGTVSSPVTIEVKAAGPNYSDWDSTLQGQFITNDINENGETESDASFNVMNSVIPHRAWHDTEGRIDYSDLQTVVLSFHDIMELAGEYKPLSQNVKANIGSISDDEFTDLAATSRTSNVFNVAYRKGTAHNVMTQYWNRALFLTYGLNKGLLSENYRYNMTQYPERVYAAEILFKPTISVTTAMILTSSDDNTLASDEKILKLDYDYQINSTSEGTKWINYCNNLTGYYFRNGDEIHKVISHEVSRLETNVFRHFLKLDNATSITNGDVMHLMRINQVCMYDFSPNKIILNDAKIEYTKVPNKDEMQREIKDATRASSADDGSDMSLDNSTNGVKSMYVLIDPDGTISNTYLETRNKGMSRSYSEIDAEGNRVLVTDGVNKFVTTCLKKNNTVEFTEIKKMLGCISIGTTFNVRVAKKPGFNPAVACIASSFKIVDEIEKVINDAFEINDISYTQDTEDDKYYGAFNFTGQSLYSAANNLLSYKNKEILVDGEEIKIVDKEDEKKYRNIVLSSKNSDFQITSISNDVSLLDNFDEVIVIGDGVRGIARNPISTTDANRTIKTKEIYDYSILDQRQADLKAIQYLDVFNTANTSIEIEVADNVPFLKPGHIIELEFEEQNIPRGDYLVIETEKEFGRPTKFILSEYSKDLAGTFSLLLGEIRNLQGFTKQKVYTSTTIPRIKRDKVNIKFVKSTATSTISTVTSTIGFGYTIGFDSEVGV